MHRITFGGSNALMCHGGGIRHKTISDLVRRIEYVDANGEHQSVTDAIQLRAAAGSFGLLGAFCDPSHALFPTTNNPQVSSPTSPSN